MLPVYPPGRFPRLELADLLEGEVSETIIRGRIVLIGSVARSLRDLFEIPQGRFQDDSQFFEVPGVELHGQRLEALQRLLHNQAPQWVTARGWQRKLLLLAMVLTGALIAERPQRIWKSVLLLSAAALVSSVPGERPRCLARNSRSASSAFAFIRSTAEPASFRTHAPLTSIISTSSIRG